MSKAVLTPADLKAVQQGIYAASVAEQEIERLKACGLECGEEEARCQHLKGFLEQVLIHYSPEPAARSSRKS